MEYFAAGERCGVILSRFNLPLSEAEVLEILIGRGFSLLEEDWVAGVQACVGVSRYQRGASIREAPHAVDCSSFIKWSYSLIGINLPRRTVQQRLIGQSVEPEEATVGDLVFTTGVINYYQGPTDDGVGHVGLVIAPGVVIHAANRKKGVIETPLSSFITEENFRGIRRIVPDFSLLRVFHTPPERCIERADDIRWVVLSALPRGSLIRS